MMGERDWKMGMPITPANLNWLLLAMHWSCIGLEMVLHDFQNCLLAMRAPSAMAANLAHTTSGSTAAWPTQVP